MSTLQVNTISESTSNSGVTVDGVLIKDNAVNTDTISEKTSGSGVTIDGILIKDGNFTQGTWTSTIHWEDNLSHTGSSGWETTNITGYYIKIGKLYQWWLPQISTSNIGTSNTFQIYKLTLPATSSSTNQSVSSVGGYGHRVRYSTTTYDNYSTMIQTSSNSSDAIVQGMRDDGSTGFLQVRHDINGYAMLSGWFIGA